MASSIVPASTVNVSSPQVMGVFARASSSGHSSDPGDHLNREALFQAAPHVHEGAEEEGITFGKETDRAARCEVGGKAFGRVLVEACDCALVVRIGDGDFVGDGVLEVFPRRCLHA